MVPYCFKQSDVPEVSGKRPPVDTRSVPIPSLLIERVQVVDPVVASADDPVVGDHGSSDAGEEDTVCAEVVAECGGRLVQKPWVPDCQPEAAASLV